jgi:acyl-CoA thioesterase
VVEALVAAQPTVDDDRRAYSLHSHFLRPSRPTAPILQEVDRIGGGRSFAL